MDLSLIFIEYHSAEDISTAVSAFHDQCDNDGFEYEIIVSSNSCYPPEQQEELRKQLPGVRWLFNERNGGFAYGMNRGLEAASGDFLLVSNPDARVKTKLSPALDFLKTHPEVGLLGARIEDANGKVQDSCRHFMWPLGMIRRQIVRWFKSRDVLLNPNVDYSRIQSVDWVIGAFMLLRREVYKKTGGFDENYFLYVEDMDWCYRIRLAGYGIYYFPPVKVEYKGDRKSTAALFRDSDFICGYAAKHFKSYCRFLKKHYFRKRPPRA